MGLYTLGYIAYAVAIAGQMMGSISTQAVSVQSVEQVIVIEEEPKAVVEYVVEETKSVLADKVIFIDAGHQAVGNSSQEPVAPGSSTMKAKVASGTRGVATNKPEYVLNLEVALKLKERLLEEGAVVHMVRETHEVNISNAERALLSNQVQADLSLRIHADASSNRSIQGFSILVPGNTYVDSQIVTISKDIGGQIEASIKKGTGQQSRGVITRNDLTGFNWCMRPSVLIEMGFMTHPEEDVLMSTESYQMQLVESIIEGLVTYYELN